MSDDTTQGTGFGEGDLFPAFDLPTANGERLRSDALRGKPAIIFLYPKADTSGCTQEAREFQAEIERLGEAAPMVIGVSKDATKALDAFARKAGLTFPLASDVDGALVEALGAWVEKSMYGRRYMGIDRSTFLLDGQGSVVRVWRKVKVPGHAAAVMAEAASLPAQ